MSLKLSKKLIVAVDGPAGSGKSTTFKAVAKRLGYTFIDTGLMYRAFTLLGIQEGADFENPETLVNLIPKFNYKATGGKIYLNQKDVTLDLNSQDVLKNINKVTSVGKIRQAMVSFQRNLAQNNAHDGIIMVGRDITSVVLPQANLKIYLDSSIERRAKRRLEQNHQELSDLAKLKQQIQKRDFEDKHRLLGALKRTADSWYIDNSNLNLKETVELVVEKIQQLEQ